MATIADFTLRRISGEPLPGSHYLGKAVLIVNTASKCGFTPQYQSLEELYRHYQDNGLAILAFPCNDFGAQEPGSNEQIAEFCTASYNTSFDLFTKVTVKGPNPEPLFRWLTHESDFPGEIRWNFTKFLLDRQGNVVARYEPPIDPLDPKITNKVEELLGLE